jgi:hydroxymethylpyrimidine/phosphomethylpyrimidine kinase
MCALAVGGLDPGGGAGVLADLRAFDAAGAFGCAALALMTVQSTAGLVSATPVDAAALMAQVVCVLGAQRVRAVKVGALGSLPNVRAVTRWLASGADVPVVVDPVLVPTRGRARLLDRDALDALRRLVAHATLVTPNAPEAAALVGAPVTDLDEAASAARALCAMGAGAALVKGGHLRRGAGPATDVLALRARGEVLRLKASPLRLPPIHGGGCVLASLVTGRLATLGWGRRVPEAPLIAAIRWAKNRHRRALLRALDVGGPMRVLSP